MNKDKQQKTGAKCGRWGSLAALLLLDVGVLALTTGSVVLLRHVMGGAFSPSFYFSLGWLLGLFPCIALSLGVYSDYLTPPHEELRLLSWSTSLFFLAIGSLVFMSHDATRYSRSIFFFSWVFSLFSLPLARAVAKKTLRHLFSWKYPCVIIGDRRRVQPLLLDIQRHMPSLDPVAVVTGEEQGTFATEFGPLPLVPLSKVEALSTRHPDCHAILSHAATGPTCASSLVQRLELHFRNILCPPGDCLELPLWLSGVDIRGTTFIRSCYKLLDSKRSRLKRVTDITLSLLSLGIVLPLAGCIALGVKCTSPGPILFRQTRVGRDGKLIRIIKFRTMYCDAGKRLKQLLSENEKLAQIWEENQKLPDDPRITPIGKLLRASSLDELPQLYNIFKGDMSLIGPRPIVEDEIQRYGEAFKLYTRVRPGLSGLWQVSGRNRTTYARRVELDANYVRNWSVWLDVWIIAKTVREVVLCRGM